ncbi:MAG TPA: hypothetical protein VJM08_09170 [Anaerolineales bacterium]|nr:hypothetical protein [Anaerolineales bacterium]
MIKFLSKRSIVVFAVLLAAVLLAIYVDTRPRLAPGQEPLTDITSIDTLRTRFNREEGYARLILLASPT